MQIDFADSRQSTLGVEWEVALVDHHSGDLRSVAQQVLEGVHAAHGGLAPDEEHPHVKQELLLNTVEIVTD
ncbi:MAG: carboxylate--amine ligase, partial [Micrococcaceae bacterium]|nr:carboxylate--amine ligase [Micrococcaceae bacterium]